MSKKDNNQHPPQEQEKMNKSQLLAEKKKKDRAVKIESYRPEFLIQEAKLLEEARSFRIESSSTADAELMDKVIQNFGGNPKDSFVIISTIHLMNSQLFELFDDRVKGYQLAKLCLDSEGDHKKYIREVEKLGSLYGVSKGAVSHNVGAGAIMLQYPKLLDAGMGVYSVYQTKPYLKGNSEVMREFCSNGGFVSVKRGDLNKVLNRLKDSDPKGILGRLPDELKTQILDLETSAESIELVGKDAPARDLLFEMIKPSSLTKEPKGKKKQKGESQNSSSESKPKGVNEPVDDNQPSHPIVPDSSSLQLGKGGNESVELKEMGKSLKEKLKKLSDDIKSRCEAEVVLSASALSQLDEFVEKMNQLLQVRSEAA